MTLNSTQSVVTTPDSFKQNAKEQNSTLPFSFRTFFYRHTQTQFQNFRTNVLYVIHVNGTDCI